MFFKEQFAASHLCHRWTTTKLCSTFAMERGSSRSIVSEPPGSRTIAMCAVGMRSRRPNIVTCHILQRGGSGVRFEPNLILPRMGANLIRAQQKCRVSVTNRQSHLLDPIGSRYIRAISVHMYECKGTRVFETFTPRRPGAPTLLPKRPIVPLFPPGSGPCFQHKCPSSRLSSRQQKSLKRAVSHRAAKQEAQTRKRPPH